MGEHLAKLWLKYCLHRSEGDAYDQTIDEATPIIETEDGFSLMTDGTAVTGWSQPQP